MDKKVAVISIDDNPTNSQIVIEKIINLGYDVIVTFDDYDFSLSWKVGKDPFIRHYMCALGKFPVPSEWELQHFTEYLLYELSHDRKILLWFKDEQTESKIIAYIKKFLLEDKNKLKEVIKTRFSKQQERAKNIPPKLTHCTACIEKGCMTDYVCHTTSIKNAIKIINEGKISSSCKIKNSNGVELSLHQNNVPGDPADYFEYVMFSFGNCQAGDRLVAERRLGHLPDDKDLDRFFIPGVRFYFRYKDLINHPRFVSDGYHYIKIRDSIAILPNIIAIVIPKRYKNNFINNTIAEMHKYFIFLEHDKHDIWSWSHEVYETIKNC